ncbi:anti-sigma factor family protein [Luteipulveratus mongoliensis]|uniref:Putative zinc-finger domain-containing protein n=1 Tax=Luteipulveratus mongoliensis TaxID=571913 RepID=A0A0K1JHD0_9MICO|nr:zf-HC2 domain-containing protein [Luteipulveratus mongoliensis]AKU15995.1 hypothetical protein VV02_09225 [Luteipulveratus mongoliensis]
MTSSTDPFEEFDAAYVLGALDDDDRAAYEQHLQTCDACTAAVAELRSLPPLLARAQPDEPRPEVPPMPQTLLPGMLRTVRRSRIRRRLAVGAAAAVAAVALVGGTAVLADRGDPPPSIGQPVAMSTASAAPIRASLHLQPMAWGTKVTMECLYEGDRAPQGPRRTYELVVLPKDGGTPQTVARWAVLPGRDATVTGSTDLTAAAISQVQVRTTDGRVVLHT